jgi:hypothetical protein
MISTEERSKYPGVDWKVYDSQQNANGKQGNPNRMQGNPDDMQGNPSGMKEKTASDIINENNPYHKNISLEGGRDESKMVDTFLGKMPRYDSRTKEEKDLLMKELIGAAALNPGMRMIGGVSGSIIDRGAGYFKKGVDKVSDYMSTGKEAEAFRAALGKGTSSENIAELGRRAKLAKESRKQEALIPKDKLHAQERKTGVYKVSESKLPEGNLGELSDIIEPGVNFTLSHAISLSNALRDYRSGKVLKEYGGKPIDTFLSRAEEIFNVEELPERSVDMIEKVLSMPTNRRSAYFTNKGVTEAYAKNGEIMNLHNAYRSKPILENYQKLQSKLKEELRAMQSAARTSDTAIPKVNQLKLNIRNLNQDYQRFMKTLPDEMKNLDKEFRDKYREYASTYKKGSKETGSSLTLRRLAEGRHSLVTDAQVVKLFSNPTAADKQAILDMGPSAARNAIYAALQKVPMGDAERMANTILDLKRTKGFDQIITPEFEKWAIQMLKNTQNVGHIKSALGIAGGGAMGALIGGALGTSPIGAAIGAASPLIYKGGKYLIKHVRK